MEFLYKAYADSGEVEEGRVAAAGQKRRAGGGQENPCSRAFFFSAHEIEKDTP